MNKCPQCGKKVTDIRDRLSETGPDWCCRGRTACGARGYYERDNKLVANEPDSARLTEIYSRLVDALMVTSDRDRVKCLMVCFVLLCTMNARNMVQQDEPFWCLDYELFEDDMKSVEDTLAFVPAGTETSPIVRYLRFG